MNSKQIQEYKQLALFLSSTLGDSYEIVLHDVIGQTSNIIAIHNPLSKRSEYSAQAEFIKDIIEKKEYKNNTDKSGFKIQAKDGKTLYGATFFIKDDDKLVGLLCINHDKSEYENIANAIIKLGGINMALQDNISPQITNAKTTSSNIADNLTKEISAVVSEIVGIDIINSNLMPTVEQKKEIIAKLYKNGIFNIKGAISEVAKILKISEPSVYRYMSEIKNTGRQEGLMYYI
ncbi:transcriptional regulator [Campylobacter sp. 19-13652]|uniref:helix-turn-helix transcriptional regulator n=1 Tax=Campylobacter sp. 19-13652 TaxID=2840180 RepID=UPI001C784199|nr:PAS domain-containing protein [Campylobacter sp. 19-13652]BCX79583.1 DNA-binding protein [Campylobacter sp. 19-13652]